VVLAKSGWQRVGKLLELTVTRMGIFRPNPPGRKASTERGEKKRIFNESLIAESGGEKSMRMSGRQEKEGRRSRAKKVGRGGVGRKGGGEKKDLVPHRDLKTEASLSRRKEGSHTGRVKRRQHPSRFLHSKPGRKENGKRTIRSQGTRQKTGTGGTKNQNTRKTLKRQKAPCNRE